MAELGVPRKRRRPAKSCQQCRRRKIRCDQNLPCSACVRTRAPLQCSYRPGTLNAGAEPTGATNNLILAPDSAQDSALSPDLCTAPSELRLQGSVVAPSDKDTTCDLRRHIHQLEAHLTSLRQLPTPADTILRQRTQSEPRDRVSGTTPQQTPDTCIPATTPRLRNASDKTKLFGQSHWLHTAEQFQVIGKFDAAEVEPSFTAAQAELTSLMRDTRSLRHTLIARSMVHLNHPIPDIRSTLPPKEVCDELVDSYLRTFEPIYRIVHVPTFWKYYNVLWEPSGSSVTPLPAPLLMKVVVILANGATFYSGSGTTKVDHTSLLRLAQAWIYSAQWWLTGPSEKSTATLDGIQVFCLLLIAKKATHSSPGGSTWLSAGSLLTMAQSMGLHRSPRVFSSLTPFQRQVRSRLWTTVLELVCMSSLDSALPPNVTADNFDTELPSNLDDDDLDASGSSEPTPRDGITDSSVQLLLAKSLPLRLKVAHLLNDFRSEESYQKVLNLGAELKMVCREIASFFHSAGPRPSRERCTLAPTDFHRRFLDICLRKYILLLHRPFMLQARKDPRFYLARQVCVESATVIGSYINQPDLDNETDSVDDLTRLSLVGRGVFKGALSLDVIIVLALEVVTQFEEEGPYQPVPDALDEINKARRAPLLQILRRISHQLLRIIDMGNPSLKRYMFLSAYLSQIEALESGQPVKQLVYETMVENLRKCHSILKAQVQRLSSSDEGIITVNEADITTTSTSVYYPDKSSVDNDTSWDISHFFDIQGLGGDEQTSWDVFM